MRMSSPEIREMIAAFLGGVDKLDCLLSRAADELARRKLVPFPLMGTFEVKPRCDSWELVDNLLERFHQLGFWTYPCRRVDGKYQVYDPVTRHLLEEAESLDYLREKYGQIDLEG